MLLLCCFYLSSSRICFFSNILSHIQLLSVPRGYFDFPPFFRSCPGRRGRLDRKVLKGAMDPWKLLDFGLNECGAIYSCFPTIMLRYKLLLGSKCKTVSFIEQIGWRPSYSSRWVIQSWWKLVFQEDKFSKNGHAGGKFCGTPSYNASKGQILKSATSGWAALPGLTFFADFFTFQWLFQLSLAYFPSLTPAVLRTYSWKLSNTLLLLEHIPRYVSHLWPIICLPC